MITDHPILKDAVDAAEAAQALANIFTSIADETTVSLRLKAMLS